MIADSECNVVFVADSLEGRFPGVYRGLASILAEHAIPLRTIPGTRDVWCLDYLPVRVAENRFVQFRYEPDYLTGKYRHLRADGEIGPTLPWLKGVRRSEIVLDGGNVVAWGDRVIVTDKVFGENPEFAREDVVASLKADLGLGELIVIPREPYDPIGHSDGMACWLGDRSVLVNDYSAFGEPLRRLICRSLVRQGLDVVELPYEPRPGGGEAMATAAGNWIKFPPGPRRADRPEVRDSSG
jgi:agmatine deiminase